MELSSVFSSDTLKAEDIEGKEPTVVIASVEMKKFDNGNKLILKFQNAKKALVANKTNSKRIAMMYGSDTDKWIGRPVTLYVDIVDFQGEPTEAIRVRVIKPSVSGDRVPDNITTSPQRMAEQPLERGPQQPMRRGPDPDDDIPF
jgi:hypothetical protein